MQNSPLTSDDPKYRISWWGCKDAHSAQCSIPAHAGHPGFHGKAGEALNNPVAKAIVGLLQGWRR